MATHSSILAWRIPRTEEPGATVHGVLKSLTQLKQLGMHAYSFVCVYIYRIFFIYSSVDRHLGCSYVLAIKNSAAVNKTFMYLFEL